MRVALLVLDSADRSYVLELVAAGELPHIGRLVRDGTIVPLRTPNEYRSEYANTALLTSRTSAQNRYWSTVHFDPATYGCVTVGSSRQAPFWDPAEGRIITFDVPHAILGDHPGTQVVGWGGHDARFQHPRASSPPELMDEIDARFGLDPLDDVEYKGGWHQDTFVHALADASVASGRTRGDIARWLLEREPDWSLFMIGMREPHSAGHVLAHALDPAHLLGSHPSAPAARARFVDVYRAVDEVVGRIAEALPPDAVLAIASPKGMDPNRDDVASGMLLPELLHRLAGNPPFLHEPKQRAWRRQGRPAMSPDPARRAGHRTTKLRAEGRMAAFKRHYHLLAPESLVRAVSRVRHRRAADAPQPAAPFRFADGSTPLLQGAIEWHPTTWYRRRWPTQPWFALPTFSDGHIRLNVQGREASGSIPLDRYRHACDDLEAALRQAVDPRTGAPIVDEVVRVRADDPLAPDGPSADLVVTWRFPIDSLVHPTAGVIGPFAFQRGGSHNPDGFLIAAGDGIGAGTTDVHPVFDVGPTVRTLLGWTPRDDLAGDVIPEMTGRSVEPRR